MIYCITGKLMLVDPHFVVVETGGVGYKCITTTYTLSQLPSRGEVTTVFTYMYVREDILDLYGFSTTQEMDAFKMLITVSGVGPKAALAILSGTSPDRLMLQIASGDVKSLKAPGVGPKIAQRIILELKDKVGNSQILAGVKGMDIGGGVSMGQGNMSSQGEAISALVTLGYSQTDAASVVSKMDNALSSQDMIRQGLKILARKL